MHFPPPKKAENPYESVMRALDAVEKGALGWTASQAWLLSHPCIWWARAAKTTTSADCEIYTCDPGRQSGNESGWLWSAIRWITLVLSPCFYAFPKCITLSATERYAGTSSQFELCRAACNPLTGNGLGMFQFGTPLPPEMRKTVVKRTISPLLFTADVTVQGSSSFIFILGFN